jgi:hypothetical protein
MLLLSSFCSVPITCLKTCTYVEICLYTNTHLCVGGTADIISVDIAMVHELRVEGSFFDGVFDDF